MANNQLTRVNNSQQLMRQLGNAFIPYLPAIMNSGSNLARGIYNQYTRPNPPQQQPMPPVRNQRRRRKKKTPIPARNIASGSSLNVSDTEYLGSTTTALQAFEFGAGSLVRLTKFFSLYTEYKFNSVTIIMQPLVGSYTASMVAIGVMAGSKNVKVTTADHIAKMNPCIYMAATKGATITVPQSILRAHALLSTDEHFFTVYVIGTGSGHASLRVKYSINMSSPSPF